MDRAIALVMLLCSISLGCGVSHMKPPPLSGKMPHRERLWAGVTEVDITPPIGLGLFGHGPESRISTGIALRLRCQIFVLTGPTGDGQDEVVALVTCDLPAPSLYLQRAIAEHVASYHVHLPAYRIALLATHTHFGPNHYFTGDGYTGPFSARRTGLDEGVVAALAKKIGDGIVKAYWNSRPARIGWTYKSVYEIGRNRSITPFLHNRILPKELEEAIAKSPEHPEDAAVDPLLSLMRVDLWDHVENAYRSAGALAFYGVHPSVISNRNSLFTGDLFGYATRAAQREIKQRIEKGGQRWIGPEPVIGLANGIEGDVTSMRATDTHRESRRLGHKLGSEIANAWADFDGDASSSYDLSGPLKIIYRELSWSEAELSGGRKLCKHPGQGTPAAGGGSDHPTSMRIFSIAHPGIRSVDPNGQRPCGWPRYPLLAPDSNAPPGANYPHIAPIMLIQVGRGLIATVPAELTTVAGYRLRHEMQKHLFNQFAQITVVGLANEYIGYIATREEYDLQHYEGASTLYGPDSARFLREQFGCLAAHLSQKNTHSSCPGKQPPLDEVVDAPYKANEIELLPEARCKSEVSPPQNISPVSYDISYEGEWIYSVTFDGPDPFDIRAWEDLEVSVVHKGVVVDDGRGETVRVLYNDAAAERSWKVQWIAPTNPKSFPCGLKLRFVVKTPKRTIKSKHFVVNCVLPRASQVWP